MLCKRPKHKIEESVKEMQGRTFAMEEKLDGERIQLHKRGNEYFYCSRWDRSRSTRSALTLFVEKEKITLTFMESTLAMVAWPRTSTQHSMIGLRSTCMWLQVVRNSLEPQDHTGWRNVGMGSCVRAKLTVWYLENRCTWCGLSVLSLGTQLTRRN